MDKKDNIFPITIGIKGRDGFFVRLNDGSTLPWEWLNKTSMEKRIESQLLLSSKVKMV